MRQKKNYAKQLNRMHVVKSSFEKYSSFELSESVLCYRYPASSRGALRAIVTTREAGMRWPRRHQALFARRLMDADGEIVWSWPPGAEVGAARLRVVAETGAIKPVPGEITYKP
ncbi:MAG: hypothetical protein ABW213_07245 [Tardiphaga sp.]